ncbi:MAG: histidine phosphatase family protein [Bacillus subtilis]|nr:histidine phosphatase family protein [Bacillus subtilis]
MLLKIILMAFIQVPCAARRKPQKIIGAKIGLDPELRPGVQEVMFFETPALVILEILSIFDPVEDYLDARVGMPIRWPIEGRVSAVLLDILAKHPNQRVAVVAHAGVISAALSWYLPEKRWRWWRTTVSNCSFNTIQGGRQSGGTFGGKRCKAFEPVIVTTQPPAVTVEVAKEIHPAEKALVFEKPPETDKK